ncbi:MAG: ATP-binding protein [Pseudomonadota bacterium]
MLSINTRIVASASVVLAVFIAATGLALDRAFHDSARSAREERLLGQVYLVIAAADVNMQGQITIAPTLSEARFNLPGSGLYGVITDATGAVIWRTPSALGMEVPAVTSLAAGKQEFDQREDRSGDSFFVYSLGVNWAAGTQHFPFTFTVAEDLTPFNTQLSLYRHSLWGWLGGMALLLLIAQAMVLRWSLRPLRHVARDLSAIEAGKQKRLEGEYPHEIKRLADNLNALLKREHAQQKRYRDALADLAHSLKTPLAVMRGTLTGEAKQATFSSALEEQIVNMDRIVAYQLQRAATAGRSGGLATRVPIRPLVEKIIASLNKVYREKPVTSSLEMESRVCFAGDQGDLTELLGNLLDNAYKWCKNAVKISARIENNRLIITVEDNGPGIDAVEAHHILERGVRTDESVPGHGIGLAVVRDIVNIYEGEIILGNGQLGGAAIIVGMPNH